MTNHAGLEEPTIPARLRRPLAAAWISIGVHAALIALVQVAPPTSPGVGPAIIEARLVDAAGTQQQKPAPAAPVPRKPDAPPVRAPADPDASPPVSARPEMPPDPAPAAEAARPPSAPTQPPSDAPAAPGPAEGPSEPSPPVELTSAVDLTYYSARELDVQPRALREIVPEYPALADRRRLSGTVRLQIELEADGRVRDVSVVSADPPGLFEDSAVTAFRAARFAPAQRKGRPVRARVLIEVVYDWEGRR